MREWTALIKLHNIFIIQYICYVIFYNNIVCDSKICKSLWPKHLSINDATIKQLQTINDHNEIVQEGMFKRAWLYHSPLIRLSQRNCTTRTHVTLTHTPVINGHLRATIINDVSAKKQNRQTFKGHTPLKSEPRWKMAEFLTLTLLNVSTLVNLQKTSSQGMYNCLGDVWSSNLTKK